MATSETARKINRSLVLETVRTGQPLSRAELARRTGLQRSTVSLIVDGLIESHWVNEGLPFRLPRGRRPRMLTLNGERIGVVGINVRPQSTTIALADLNMQFRWQERISTGSDAGEFLRELAERTRSIVAHAGLVCDGIGVSVPGRVDRRSQRLAFAPNLGWRDVDVRTPLESLTGLPVQVENAANACALAESWTGPHRGVRDLIAVTVSEGIGTGIIANGHLVRGADGTAGEFGHVALQADGPLCGCGNRGCWEVFGSNSAAVRHYQSLHPTPAALNFEQLLLRYEKGEAAAARALEMMASALGRGIAMLVTGFAPAVVVIVGEVTRVWNRIGPLVDAEVRARARTHSGTLIVPSDDATQPRLRGMIALALQKYFSVGPVD